MKNYLPVLKKINFKFIRILPTVQKNNGTCAYLFLILTNYYSCCENNSYALFIYISKLLLTMWLGACLSHLFQAPDIPRVSQQGRPPDDARFITIMACPPPVVRAIVPGGMRISTTQFTAVLVQCTPPVQRQWSGGTPQLYSWRPKRTLSASLCLWIMRRLPYRGAQQDGSRSPPE